MRKIHNTWISCSADRSQSRQFWVQIRCQRRDRVLPTKEQESSTPVGSPTTKLFHTHLIISELVLPQLSDRTHDAWQWFFSLSGYWLHHGVLDPGGGQRVESGSPVWHIHWRPFWPLKDQLTPLDFPADLDSLFSLTIKIDKRLFEKEWDRRSSTYSVPHQQMRQFSGGRCPS